MATRDRELDRLLHEMQPVLHEGIFVYSSLPSAAGLDGIDLVAAMREREGWSVVVSEAEAQRLGLPVLFRAAWITLEVHSELAAVGFTAAFSAALAGAGIGCNVVAGAHHDHVFVPFERAAAALECLRALQTESPLPPRR